MTIIDSQCTCVRRACQHGASESCDACVRTLRPYQAEHVRFACASRGNAMIVSPTGSGKTVEIVACVPLLLTSSASHIVIVTPQEHVEVAFTERSYRYIGFPSVLGMSQRLFEVGPSLIQAARSIGGRQSVEDYLRQPGPMPYALCTTHAAWRGVKLPDVDLSGHVLFVDEAHRAPAKCFAEQSEKWSSHRGLVRYFTATDYRGDGQPVLLPGMVKTHRNLALHMDEGWAPRHFRSSLMPLGREGDSVSKDQLRGDAGPSRPNELASAMVDRWIAEERPKVVVRVPPMTGGSQSTVQVVVDRFREAGARVVDASGLGVSQATQLVNALRAESQCCYACSKIDVIVGIQRVSEGLDWIHCAAVYSYGIPGSPTLYNQLAGRSLRKKADDHPHKDDAWINFFVDTAGGTVLDSMSLSHSRETLLMCCYAVDTDVGLRWAFLKAARQGVVMATKERDATAMADAMDVGLSHTKALGLLTVAAYLEQEPRAEAATLATVLKNIGIPQQDAQLTLLELLCMDRERGEAVQARVAEATAMATRNERPPLSGLGWLFDEVLEEFRGVTLEHNPAIQQLGAQMHKLTGSDMLSFTQRLMSRAGVRAASETLSSAINEDPPYEFDDLCHLWDEALPDLTDEGVFSEDGRFVATVHVTGDLCVGTWHDRVDAAFVNAGALEAAVHKKMSLWTPGTKGECALAWNLSVAATKRDVIATLLRSLGCYLARERQFTHRVYVAVRHALNTAPAKSPEYRDYHHASTFGQFYAWPNNERVLAAVGYDGRDDDVGRTVRQAMTFMKWTFYQSVRGPSRLLRVADYEERQEQMRARLHQAAAETTGGSSIPMIGDGDP